MGHSPRNKERVIHLQSQDFFAGLDLEFAVLHEKPLIAIGVKV